MSVLSVLNRLLTFYNMVKASVGLFALYGFATFLLFYFTVVGSEETAELARTLGVLSYFIMEDILVPCLLVLGLLVVVLTFYRKQGRREVT